MAAPSAWSGSGRFDLRETIGLSQDEEENQKNCEMSWIMQKTNLKKNAAVPFTQAPNGYPKGRRHPKGFAAPHSEVVAAETGPLHQRGGSPVTPSSFSYTRTTTHRETQNLTKGCWKASVLCKGLFWWVFFAKFTINPYARLWLRWLYCPTTDCGLKFGI